MTLKQKAQICLQRKNELPERYMHSIRYVIQMPEHAGIKACMAQSVNKAYQTLMEKDAART